MTAKKCWARSEVFSLISEWQLYPELWDIKSKSFRNKIKKQNALKKLAINYSTNEHEITRKMHNLRTQFHQEYRREKLKHKNGEETYQSNWEYFHAMKFICYDYPTTSNEKINGQMEKVSEIETEFEDSTNYESIEIEEKFEPATLWTIQQNEQPEEDCLQRTMTIQTMNNKPISDDDFQIFGNFVAAELRNLKSPEHQRQLKLKIQRAIIEIAEIDGRTNPSSCLCSNSPSSLYSSRPLGD